MTGYRDEEVFALRRGHVEVRRLERDIAEGVKYRQACEDLAELEGFVADRERAGLLVPVALTASIAFVRLRRAFYAPLSSGDPAG